MGVGTWRVLVKDTNVNGHIGTFINWRLNLWGEAINGSSKVPHSFPGEADDYGTETATMTSTAYTHDVMVDPTVSMSPVKTPPPNKATAFEGLGRKEMNLLLHVIVLAFAVVLAIIVLFAWNYFQWARHRNLIIDPDGRPFLPRTGGIDVSESVTSSEERHLMPRSQT